MEKKNTKIFIIYGKARHGKDTVAGIIEEYYKNEKVINLQISSSLKEYAKKISGWKYGIYNVSDNSSITVESIDSGNGTAIYNKTNE